MSRDKQSPRISLVVAVADNGVIGLKGGMPWRLPADMKHFKTVTMGHPVVMGRKTWESIGKPLPGRANIVLTRSAGFEAPGAEVVHDLESALTAAARAPGGEDVMIIGGAALYEFVLPEADVIYLTEVHAEPEGDTFFPAFERAEWRETSREDFAAEGETPAYSFVTLVRAVL